MNTDRLTNYLDSLTEQLGVPMGDLCVRRNHKVIYRHRFGCADYKGQRPLSGKHYFRLYSCTKVITMIAVLQQIEAGHIHLTDYLSQFLPEYAEVRPITIANLMSMTAGFSYDTKDPNIMKMVQDNRGVAPTRDVIRALSKTPLLFEPGSRWLYSLAHDVLAAVVEVTSGERFGEYLKKHIFHPLGIEDLVFYQPAMGNLDGKLCDLYCQMDGRIVPASDEDANTYIFGLEYESGGAGLCGTVEAYSVIMDALAGGGVGESGERILLTDTINILKTPITTTEQLHNDFLDFGKIGYEYGYGVRVRTEEGSSPLGEFGWDGAAGSYGLVDTEHQLSIAYGEHILFFGTNYDTIHPTIRDLVYECLLDNE